jgi:hypothetical protein
LAWDATESPYAKESKVSSDENRSQNILSEICLAVELDVEDDNQSAKIFYGIGHNGLDDLSNVEFYICGNPKDVSADS